MQSSNLQLRSMYILKIECKKIIFLPVVVVEMLPNKRVGLNCTVVVDLGHVHVIAAIEENISR
jgi:hypothetical protein